MNMLRLYRYWHELNMIWHCTSLPCFLLPSQDLVLPCLQQLLSSQGHAPPAESGHEAAGKFMSLCRCFPNCAWSGDDGSASLVTRHLGWKASTETWLWPHTVDASKFVRMAESIIDTTICSQWIGIISAKFTIAHCLRTGLSNDDVAWFRCGASWNSRTLMAAEMCLNLQSTHNFLGIQKWIYPQENLSAPRLYQNYCKQLFQMVMVVCWICSMFNIWVNHNDEIFFNMQWTPWMPEFQSDTSLLPGKPAMEYPIFLPMN